MSFDSSCFDYSHRCVVHIVHKNNEKRSNECLYLWVNVYISIVVVCIWLVRQATEQQSSIIVEVGPWQFTSFVIGSRQRVIFRLVYFRMSFINARRPAVEKTRTSCDNYIKISAKMTWQRRHNMIVFFWYLVRIFFSAFRRPKP